MKAGKIKITNRLIHDALNFPPDWHIESIKTSTDPHDINHDIFEMVISGSDFPEVKDAEETEIKDCEITWHKEHIWWEVKEST